MSDKVRVMRSAGAGLEPQVRVMRSAALEPQIRVMKRAGEEEPELARTPQLRLVRRAEEDPRLGRSPQLRVMRRSGEEERPMVRIVRAQHQPGDMQKMTGGGW